MLKLIFTHLFINLYLLALVQPALPVIEYLFNYDYIANELCENKDKPILTCNGKCYLEKQVKKQQNLDRDQTVPLPPKIDLEKFFLLKNKKFTYSVQKVEQVQHKLWFYLELEEETCSNSLLRPPIV